MKFISSYKYITDVFKRSVLSSRPVILSDADRKDSAMCLLDMGILIAILNTVYSLIFEHLNILYIISSILSLIIVFCAYSLLKAYIKNSSIIASPMSLFLRLVFLYCVVSGIVGLVFGGGLLVFTHPIRFALTVISTLNYLAILGAINT